MRNFILFIRRFFNLILFLGLEIVCIILIAHTNTLQGNDIVSSANTISGIIYQKQADVVYYFGLRKMNDSLINENARLRKKLSQLQATDTLKSFTVKQALPNSDTTQHVIQYADYRYQSARVINNSISAANNYITIDRGSDDGVHAGMAVISGSGAVGKVVHVSSHYASVISILSVKQQVSARLKDGTYGHVEWEGDKPDILQLKDISQEIPVRPGDSVYTTSYSFFPSDILIGVVFKIEPIKKNNLQIIYLHPSINFRNLQYVYVVSNSMENERKQLEEEAKTKGGKK